MFKVHIQSKLLKCRTLLVPLSGTGKERGGDGVGGGTACTGEYKIVQAVRPGLVAGKGKSVFWCSDL